MLDVLYPGTPSLKTWSDCSWLHLLPFVSSLDDCPSEALSLLLHFVNTPVGLAYGSQGPSPLYSWKSRCLPPCSLFAFCQEVDSTVYSGASSREGRHRSCLPLCTKMDPGDLWIPPSYCSVEFPDTCFRTSMWPWIPVSALCFYSPQPGVAVATLPSVLWDMACTR